LHLDRVARGRFPNSQAIKADIVKVLQKMSSMFSPDEKVVLSSKGSLEQPIKGSGELYLTDKRLFLVHKSGLISKRETPLLDVRIGEVSYVKVEGSLRKVLVVGVRGTGGQILAYKVHVPAPESWSAQIYNLKGGGSTTAWPAPIIDEKPLPSQTASRASRFCSNCGQPANQGAKFCPSCGQTIQ
jgi:zinc-ribbon domain